MEKDEISGPVLPEGFEHVAERVQNTTERIEGIDKQIDSLPKDRGLSLEYRPPYFVGQKPGQQQRNIAALKEMQYQLKTDALEKTEADTRDADPKDGRIVRDQVRQKLFPNPYRELSREDRLADKSAVKEIEQSQDYMDALLVEKAANRDSLPPVEQQSAEPSVSNTASMSARFSMSLGYTKLTDKTDVAPAPARDRQQDIDRE